MFRGTHVFVSFLVLALVAAIAFAFASPAHSVAQNGPDNFLIEPGNQSIVVVTCSTGYAVLDPVSPDTVRCAGSEQGPEAPEPEAGQFFEELVHIFLDEGQSVTFNCLPSSFADIGVGQTVAIVMCRFNPTPNPISNSTDYLPLIVSSGDG